ncbi:MAG: hypothetical protein LBT91_03195 [Bifidobacteriaceae bacterium]|jgi:hypothetical protein|nr:hypothetical protein [Bifidobacteriaceae bacterium]
MKKQLYEKTAFILTALLSIYIVASGQVINFSRTANAKDINNVLSVAKGGTGQNHFNVSSILLGNAKNSLNSTNIDNSLISSSNNLASSQAIWNSSNPPLELLERSEVLEFGAKFTAWDGGDGKTINPFVVKQGNLIFIGGAFKAKEEIPADTIQTILTLKSPYLSGAPIGVSCSNNFFGNMQTPRVQCATPNTGNTVRIKTEGLITTPKFIDLSYYYLI